MIDAFVLEEQAEGEVFSKERRFCRHFSFVHSRSGENEGLVSPVPDSVEEARRNSHGL
ncbi:MAG: hypothetical protein FD153_787 [Rhodospirillaceae bacterium]|nr:MAG: hypothetical protein FD153_787 [Rhodospirillaceae bacterium]